MIGFKCFIKVGVFQFNKFKRNIAMNAQKKKNPGNKDTSGLDDLDAILMEVELETRKKAVAAAAKSIRKSGKGM
ncbi:unnamed protein product [Brugia timori]|uniref:DUF1192 domain-containing protein n=1 Tax=Brugia timori TaxID=42155 RepID=A0A0R3QH66_9BILA|nr:unnamed protein product [Brugia timori]